MKRYSPISNLPSASPQVSLKSNVLLFFTYTTRSSKINTMPVAASLQAKNDTVFKNSRISSDPWMVCDQELINFRREERACNSAYEAKCWWLLKIEPIAWVGGKGSCAVCVVGVLVSYIASIREVLAGFREKVLFFVTTSISVNF